LLISQEVLEHFSLLHSRTSQNPHLTHSDQYVSLILQTSLPPNHILSPDEDNRSAYVQVRRVPDWKVQVPVFYFFVDHGLFQFVRYNYTLVINLKKRKTILPEVYGDIMPIKCQITVKILRLRI
jgi:hypothetical protein